jgi:hypothetical protein
MAQHNIDAILGWWLLEGQGNKTWLLDYAAALVCS